MFGSSMGYLFSDGHFSHRLPFVPLRESSLKPTQRKLLKEGTSRGQMLQKRHIEKLADKSIKGRKSCKWLTSESRFWIQNVLEVLQSYTPTIDLADHSSPLEGPTLNMILEQAGCAFFICPRRNTKDWKDSLWKQKGTPLFLTTSKYHEAGVLAQSELSWGWFLHMDLALKLLEQHCCSSHQGLLLMEIWPSVHSMEVCGQRVFRSDFHLRKHDSREQHSQATGKAECPELGIWRSSLLLRVVQSVDGGSCICWFHSICLQKEDTHACGTLQVLCS